MLTVLAFTLAIAWDRSSRNEVSGTSSPAVAEKTNPSVHGTKIQDIQLGEREGWLKNIPMVFMWIYVKDQYALRDLVRMETDPDLRRQYKAGLDRCAEELHSFVKKRNSNKPQANSWT